MKRKPTKKKWVQATSPDGILYIVWQLGKFCEKMGLDKGNVSHALSGSSRYSSVKGWVFRRLSLEGVDSYGLQKDYI